MSTAQERLVMAAQQRRAMEYEKELAAWRKEKGLPPLGAVPVGFNDEQPISQGQALGIVLGLITLCVVSAGLVWVVFNIVLLMGGGLS